LYVSFETIEHIRDDAAYLREALRVLKKGGVFICSTPNRLIVHPAATLLDRPISSYGHVREYAFEELDPLLCGCFASVDWFGQAYYGRRYCRFLKMVGQRMPRLAVRTHQIRKLLELPLRRSGFYQPRVLDTQRSPEVLVAVCRA
jgi:SAM-dependent methyltransferase